MSDGQRILPFVFPRRPAPPKPTPPTDWLTPPDSGLRITVQVTTPKKD